LELLKLPFLKYRAPSGGKFEPWFGLRLEVAARIFQAQIIFSTN
jgi:hypothetical protein